MASARILPGSTGGMGRTQLALLPLLRSELSGIATRDVNRAGLSRASARGPYRRPGAPRLRPPSRRRRFGEPRRSFSAGGRGAGVPASGGVGGPRGRSPRDL